MKRTQIIIFLRGSALIVAAILPWMKPVDQLGEAATDVGLILTLAGGLAVVIGGLLKVPSETAKSNSRINIHV